MDAKVLQTGTVTDDELRCEALSPICQDSEDRIVSIGQESGNWRLVLRNKFDKEVILDSKFNFIGTRRLTEAKEK